MEAVVLPPRVPTRFQFLKISDVPGLPAGKGFRCPVQCRGVLGSMGDVSGLWQATDGLGRSSCTLDYELAVTWNRPQIHSSDLSELNCTIAL